jgi:hypothetical protein
MQRYERQEQQQQQQQCKNYELLNWKYFWLLTRGGHTGAVRTSQTDE